MTSALPLDWNSYFTSLSEAQAAAATADVAGSSTTVYYYGQQIMVVEGGVATLYVIQPDKTLKAAGSALTADGTSIAIVDGQVQILGFAAAEAGAQPRKKADGSIEWIKPDTTTVEGLQTAVEGLESDVESLTSSVASNTSAIQTLNGSGEGSVSKQVADAVAQIVSDAPEAYDTLKEISDWISSHASDAAEMNSSIQQNASDIGTLETTVANKVDKVEGKQLSTEDYTTAEKEKLAGIAAGAQANVIETIQVNGAAQTPSGKTVNISVPTGALASKSEVAESDLAAALASKINGKVDNSALAAIAKTGNINDLVQTSGDVLVLNCGTSSTVL